jgi:hypothetical protein
MIDDKYTVKHALQDDHVHVFIFNNHTRSEENIYSLTHGASYTGTDVYLPNCIEKLFRITFESKIRKEIRKAQKVANFLNNSESDYLERSEQIKAIYKQLKI